MLRNEIPACSKMNEQVFYYVFLCKITIKNNHYLTFLYAKKTITNKDTITKSTIIFIDIFPVFTIPLSVLTLSFILLFSSLVEIKFVF